MRRVIIALAVLTFVLEAAWLVLGPPDVVGATAFLTNGIPDPVATESALAVLAWILILVACGVLLAGMTRWMGRSRILRQPSSGAGILLAVGLLLLGVSVVHHTIAPVPLCCDAGSAAAREAIRLAQ